VSEFIEWVPKHHGHQPLHWKPDMLTSVDGKNFVRQPNWAWIAGSVYYVPPEAVGMVREDVEEETDEQHTGLTSLYYKGRDGVLREVVRVSAKEFAELKHNLQGIPTVYAVWPEEEKQP
jgi:hypothetical protein